MNPAVSVSDEELTSALVSAREVAKFLGSDFARGVVQTLAWLLGDGVAPLDSSLSRLERASIVRLEVLAEDAIYGGSSGRDFVVGVENALSWARGRSPSPPL